MVEYTAYEPPQWSPQAGATPAERAESMIFVRDGFSWGAFLLGPFYFLFHARWLSLALYLLALMLINGLVSAVEAGPSWVGLLTFLLNLVAGYEVSEVRRWSLRRAGWQELASVSGRNEEDCERNFFTGWLAGAEHMRPVDVSLAPARAKVFRAWSIEEIENGLREFAQRLRRKFATKA